MYGTYQAVVRWVKTIWIGSKFTYYTHNGMAGAGSTVSLTQVKQTAALRVLDESIKLCLAAGINDDNIIIARVHEELIKQRNKKPTVSKSGHALTLEEVVDLHMCLAVYMHLDEITLSGVEIALHEKLLTMPPSSMGTRPDGSVFRKTTKKEED